MGNRNWYLGLCVVAASALLGACSAEEEPARESSETPPVQTPVDPAPPATPPVTPPVTPPTTPPVTPAPPVASNAAPTIQGTPSTSATVGVAWQFQPAAQDADGHALTFSATGLPSWATISTTTGLVSGIPAGSSAGTADNIVITVSDGQASASLPAFSLTVAQPVVKGTATLRWSAPTQYTDGSTLTNGDLVAFHIYYGKSSTSLQKVAEVDARSASFIMKELDRGTHYFAVTAVSASGTESTYSTVGSKTIS